MNRLTQLYFEKTGLRSFIKSAKQERVCKGGGHGYRSNSGNNPEKIGVGRSGLVDY